MPIPSTGAVSMLNIRDEYVNAIVGSSVYGSSNTNLFNLNYYRGKSYYRSSDGAMLSFSSGTITMNDFRGTQSFDPFPPPPPPPPGP